MDAEVFVLRDAAELQATLGGWAELRAGLGLGLIFHVRFSGHAEAQGLAKAMATGEVVVVGATAKCEVYRMALDEYAFQPQFWKNFEQALAALPPTFDPLDPVAYLEFVDAFGTHVPVELTMGGHATQLAVVGKANFTAMVNANVDLETQMKMSILGLFGSSVTQHGAYHLNAFADFESNVTYNTTRCRPFCPPAGSNVATNTTGWASRLRLSEGASVPIGAKFVPITTWMRNRTDMLAGLGRDKVAALADSLDAFLNGTDSTPNSYCSLVDGCGVWPGLMHWSKEAVDTTLWGPPRSGLGVLVGEDESVYAMGGVVDPKNNVPSASMHILLPDKGGGAGGYGWTKGKDMPSPLSFARAHWINGSVVVVGHNATDHPTMSFDVDTKEWQPRSFQSIDDRTQYTTAAVGQTIYVIGGAFSNGTMAETVLAYDFAADTWSALRSNAMPVPAMNPVAHPIGAHIYVFGGQQSATDYISGGQQSATDYISTVQVFDTASASWQPLGQSRLPWPRAGGSALDVGGGVALVGGWEVPLSVEMSALTVPRLNLNLSMWEELPHVLAPDPLLVANKWPNSPWVWAVGPDGNTYKLGRIPSSPATPPQSPLAAASPFSARPKRVPALPKQRSKDAKEAVLPYAEAFAHGYNRLLGSPGEGVDPGWRPQPILDVTCADCLEDGTPFTDRSGRTWLVPAGLAVEAATACSYRDVDLRLLRDTKSAQSAMSKTTSFEDRIGIPILAGFEFSASVHMAQLNESMFNASMDVILATATCRLLTGQRSLQHPPTFTENFLQALTALPATLDTLAPYVDFVENFGTHLPNQLVFGGSVTTSSFLARLNLTMLQRDSIDLHAAARAGILFLFGAHAAGGVNFDTSAYNTFTTALSHNKTSCKPKCPPSDPAVWDDVVGSRVWSDSLLRDGGAPIHASMQSLPSLLRQALLDRKLPSSLTTQVTNLEKFLGTRYCALVPGCVQTTAGHYETPTSPMLTPRRALATALVSDSMLVAAGGIAGVASDYSDGTPLDVVESMAAGEEWITQHALPFPRFLAGAAADVTGELYVVGGVDTQGVARAEVVKFPFSSGALKVWSNVRSMQHARAGASVHIVDRTLYVVGGLDDSGAALASMETLNLSPNGSTLNVWNVTALPQTCLRRHRWCLAASCT